MARPRQFDEEEVLNKAMMCFWEKGYSSASINDLEQATGISRISLYNAFKDKQGLFMAIQKRYHDASEAFMRETLSGESLDTLIAFLKWIPVQEEEGTPKDLGCMIVNTSLDVHNVGEEVIENVKQFRKMLQNMYIDFFSRCQKAGEMRSDLVPKLCANFIITSLWGTMATSRLYKDIREAKPQIDMLVATVESWKT